MGKAHQQQTSLALPWHWELKAFNPKQQTLPSSDLAVRESCILPIKTSRRRSPRRAVDSLPIQCLGGASSVTLRYGLCAGKLSLQ